MYNLMLLKCKTLYALKFALVSKMEAMHHLAIENMKSLKVKIYSLRTSFFFLLLLSSSLQPSRFALGLQMTLQGHK